jgi:hypothetical protein
MPAKALQVISSVISYCTRSVRFMICAAILTTTVALPGEEARITFDPNKHVIWIPVRVDGGRPLSFALDSAATSSVIDWDRAEELKIPFTSLGERRDAGTGDGTSRGGRTGPVRLAFPGATLDLPAMGVVPLRGVSETYGRRMDGLIGADLLARYVVEFDWEQRRLALDEPATFRYSGEGAVVPLIVAGGAPFVRLVVSVQGAAPVEGIFLIDCPHPGTIIMNTPFVRDNGLLDAARKNLPRLVTQFAEGVGGKSEILHGRITEVKLGPFPLREVVVAFSQAKAGSLARPEFAGILGAEILRRFRVVLDFSRERMILEPKASLSQPFRYDASGIRLRSSGEDFREFRVTGVIDRSPAERAKLQEGDRVIRINGTPAETLSLGEILEVLKREGETVSLRVQRGSQQLDVELALRKLI